jgi:hypothetical protein
MRHRVFVFNGETLNEKSFFCFLGVSVSGFICSGESGSSQSVS